MKSYRSKVPVSVAVIAVIASLLLATGCGSEPGTANDAPPDKDFVARISVVGEISGESDRYTSSDDSYHHDWTKKTIDNLVKNERNKGLLIYVDSPGGAVYESDELYLKIMEYKEKTGRPVYVYMGPMAASGGYYISAGADKIYANRNTWTGSIGVISGTYFDVSGFLAKHGIKATDVTSGRNKGMGGYFEPMTDEQRAIIQSIVDESYGQFVSIVADGRGMDVEIVKQVADGRIYTAKQAKGAGLIDDVLTEVEAIEAVKAEMGDSGIAVSDIRFVPADDIFGLGGADPFSIFGFGKAGGRDDGGDISRVLDLATSDGRVPLKYLYRG
ncbi:MAG: signal peptide peptidase SppA [Clostridiales Family XIII bacterium]|jgi:protease-4|nr:signal peptide peptidase SppA [Clostridiales Family XIII bacterium]